MSHQNDAARSMPLADFASLNAEEREALARIVSDHHGLDDVFAWGRRQSPPVHPADVVKHDGFTQDVLVPLPSGRWLVYGTT
jgi:hypothetical protein